MLCDDLPGETRTDANTSPEINFQAVNDWFGHYVIIRLISDPIESIIERSFSDSLNSINVFCYDELFVTLIAKHVRLIANGLLLREAMNRNQFCIFEVLFGSN